MTRKVLALVPSALPSSADLQRFHPDAADTPLLSIVLWTSLSTGLVTRTRQFALDKDKRNLLELQRVRPVDGARSWFVGNAVLQDGGVTVFSPVDALFVLLDAAWPQRARFSSVYDLLATAGNTWLLQLSTLRELIECICDVQDIEGDDGVENLFVKIEENKVMPWLRTKVERVAKVLLKQEQDSAAKAATTAAFNEQVNILSHRVLDETMQEETIQDEGGDVARHHRHAIDVVGNYLADEWIDVLCSEFGVEKEKEVKTVAKAEAGPIDTFQRFDRRRVPENGAKRPTSIGAASVKKKSKLDNVDRSGMKSLMSFFGKK
ncbi:unnamed protein product [Hyaloperonospora brassicae]|uniref:Ribonuclease H2 subunit B wHTH domain-containing protein n=1 Tax=Hyaloperonospora brassicae TaxID=162125 RepID=A0AAV0T171_HYABA|nr:unnamed protein product [Hyaloperonospora brassicae]